MSRGSTPFTRWAKTGDRCRKLSPMQAAPSIDTGPAAAHRPRADTEPANPVAPRTLVVIPARNEAGRIEAVLDALRALGHHLDLDLDLLVVDDGSVDATRERAQAHGATVLSHPFNLGYGTALQTGYIYAQRRGYHRVVQMDADGQHDPASLPALLDALEGHDLVVGSRFRIPGNAPPTTLMRRLGSLCFAWIVTRWTRVRITDPTSGFQALSRAALAALAQDGFPEDYPDADVLIRLSTSGLKLTEIPVKMHPRLGGVSMHRGTRAVFYAYKMFMSLTLLRVRRRSPYRAVERSPV
jgi:glycosyltransferase involved in cell wall biosynthesis